MKALSILFALIVVNCAIKSQVTIGNNSAPEDGALLQLKENDNLSVNSKKGLGMPRVLLTKVNNLEDIGITDTNKHLNHKGLVVYNPKESDEFCEGLYTWDGNQWAYLAENTFEGSNFNPNTGILTDFEGNKYRTGQFGSAGTWMLENLRTRKYLKCGEKRYLPVNGIVADSNYERQIAFPNKYNTITTDSTYFLSNPEVGLLYNWCAATSRVNAVDSELSNDNLKIKGICPNGWHIPSKYEVNELMSEIDNNTPLYANTTLSVNGYNGTIYPNLSDKVLSANQPNLSVTNYPGISKTIENGGLNILAVGYAINGKISSNSTQYLYADFWFANNVSADNAAYWFVHPFANSVELEGKVWNKKALFSIRCKKD